MNQTIHYIPSRGRLLLLALLLSIAAAPALSAQTVPHTLKGQVLSAKSGEPLAAATIKIKNTALGTTTDNQGRFNLDKINENTVLVVSSIGFVTQEVTPDGKTEITVELKPSANLLDETVVRGYGTTTRRLNTGSISTVTAKEISQQPVTNVLAALAGRMPGVDVQTQNGLPGGGVSIQIRGKNSIKAGTEPLYIIDGVPYPSSPLSGATRLSDNISGATNPFSSINPDDVESITVLKDADATAIYGSRGANGVILITTKKGKTGMAKFDINLSQGIRKVANMPNLLSPSEYLQIRREAFKHDGIVPSNNPTSAGYAPDLMVWDTTKHTDWRQYLFGGNAHVTNLQFGVSGGKNETTFRIGANYDVENTVILSDNRYQRIGTHWAIQHTSENRKFNIRFTGSYNTDNTKYSNLYSSLGNMLFLPPDFPIYDQSGDLNWEMNYNPVASSKARSYSTTESWTVNGSFFYTLLSGLTFKTSIGYAKVSADQILTYPRSSQNPDNYNYGNYSDFGHIYNKSIILEPQLNYRLNTGLSHFLFLLGGTYQTSTNYTEVTRAEGFNNESLMEDLSSANKYTPYSATGQYKYVSLFGRITYNLKNKYIINASARRDGSSRFGPGNRFGDFGSVGIAWLWGNENWIRRSLSFISYGKLRGSYGVTGNDQINDYQYLATYRTSVYLYEGIKGLEPEKIANANFRWESNKKSDLAMELGLFKDRILLTIERYHNMSSNQLISYDLPYLTGFGYYQANLPALVINKGWEFSFNTSVINTKYFSWLSNINLTFPQNRLKRFPNLESSSYSRTFKIGEDITRITGYRLIGVSPETGESEFAGEDGMPSASPYYYYRIAQATPKYYGGFGNNLTYRNFSLTFFIQFAQKQQKGGIVYTPGTMRNSYKIVVRRWQDKGDKTKIPKPSTRSDYHYSVSSGNYFNVTYQRVKNISLSYRLPRKWITMTHLQNMEVYSNLQNIFTRWDKQLPLYDPETGMTGVPPMKSIVFGLKLTF